MDNIFYTYIHIRPDTNEPFYVGKGKGRRHKTKTGRNQYWHNVVNKNNGVFESKIIFEGLTEKEALLKEVEVEKELKEKGYNLVNLAETGNSGPVGVSRTEEHKQSLSKSTKGRVSPNKGKKHDPFPEESKYWKGKNRPEDTKIKQSSSQSKRWEERGNELKQNFRNKVGKKVLQIETKTLTPLEIFPSIIEAQEQTQINGIRNCAAGLQKTAGGYIWVYKHPENPYFEYIINGNEVIRVFENDDLGTEELWHRDLEDRTIEAIGETDWQLQLDNCLPTSLKERIFIPRHEWHRVIKGTGTLKLKIHKS
jgi:alkylated DNA nucleotide flippase Atl1